MCVRQCGAGRRRTHLRRQDHPPVVAVAGDVVQRNMDGHGSGSSGVEGPGDASAGPCPITAPARRRPRPDDASSVPSAGARSASGHRTSRPRRHRNRCAPAPRRARGSAPPPRVPGGRAAAIAGLHATATRGATAARKAWLDEVLLPWCGTSSTSLEGLRLALDQRQLLRELDVAGEQRRALRAAHAQNTAERVRPSAGGVGGLVGVQHLELHAVPGPVLPRQAALLRPGPGAQRVVVGQRAAERTHRHTRQQRRGTADMVAVAVAEQQQIDQRFAACAQQRSSTRWPASDSAEYIGPLS